MAGVMINFYWINSCIAPADDDSNSLQLQMQALVSRWCLPMLFVILLTTGQNLFQPLLIQATKTQIVYTVTNNTAIVYNGTSLYNATVAPNENVSNSLSSFQMLAKLAEFSTGSNSISTVLTSSTERT